MPKYVQVIFPASAMPCLLARIPLAPKSRFGPFASLVCLPQADRNVEAEIFEDAVGTLAFLCYIPGAACDIPLRHNRS